VIRRFDRTLTVEVAFRTREKPLVTAELLENKVAYIRIPSFDAGTGFETLALLSTLFEKGAKAVLLDFRSNSGGLSMEATLIASIFKQGNFMQRRYRRGVVTERGFPVGLTFAGPLAILLDKDSASASEVIPFILKGQARLFGENATETFGKGIGQSLYGLSNGWYYLFTVSQFYDFNGKTYHGVGVTVHETIKTTDAERAGDKDPARDHVVKWLLTQIK